MMSSHGPNPIFFNNKRLKIERQKHSLDPNPSLILAPSPPCGASDVYHPLSTIHQMQTSGGNNEGFFLHVIPVGIIVP